MITEIPNLERDDLLAALENLVRTWSTLASYAEQIAAHRKTMFDAYLKAGFTEAQAIEMAKSTLL